jgi:hypothetical protein
MAGKKDKVRQVLAHAHYAFEPGITQIYAVLSDPKKEAKSSEPIKLLEVNQDTIASGVLPLGFDPAPAKGIPYPSIIIEVTPAEMEQIRARELPLPHGWTLGPLIPRANS